ncbi:MAG: TIGR00730 family Rossman fold protein [Proteobacteria bacterium]|nr:TIGR00730 family Rossman fold protein [Pseudomonadota bacterium]
MMRNEIRSVCVYCGSSFGNQPVFRDVATALGKELAESGVRLVYGGGAHGLMGEVARSVLAHGGEVTGIIPHFLKARESMLEGAQEMIVTDHMHERKRLMFEKSDAFVALPGGVGTLEELVEQLTWAQLGQHKKPILLLNTASFWKPLLVLLAHMREFAFIRPETEVHYLVAEQVKEVMPMLLQAANMAQLAQRAQG